MTDQKRGRGRPRKVIIAEPKEVYDAPKLSPEIQDEPDIFLLKERRGGTTIAVNKKLIPDEPFPDNWASLSKAARLSWLTANRRK